MLYGIGGHALTQALCRLGCNAQSKFSHEADGAYLSKMLGWGIAVMMVRPCRFVQVDVSAQFPHPLAIPPWRRASMRRSVSVEGTSTLLSRLHSPASAPLPGVTLLRTLQANLPGHSWHRCWFTSSTSMVRWRGVEQLV